MVAKIDIFAQIWNTFTVSDVHAQKAFLEEYESLKKNKEKEDVILFMDAVHPQHNSVISNGWIKQGKAFRFVAIGQTKT